MSRYETRAARKLRLAADRELDRAVRFGKLGPHQLVRHGRGTCFNCGNGRVLPEGVRLWREVQWQPDEHLPHTGAIVSSDPYCSVCWGRAIHAFNRERGAA